MINLIIITRHQCGNNINIPPQGHNLEKRSKSNVHLLDETLFINNFGPEDVGDYKCIATNQAGTQESNVLHLGVKGKNVLSFI